MAFVFKEGKIDVELDAGMIEALAKCGMAASIAAGGVAVAVGGTAAASSLAVPAAGMAAASATVYVAANTASDDHKVDVIEHSQPKSIEKLNFADAIGTAGGGDSSYLPPEMALKTAVLPNQSAEIAKAAMQRARSSDIIDPKIAEALKHYGDFKNIMEEMGFIPKLEENQAYTTSKEYGCPTMKMSRSQRITLG